MSHQTQITEKQPLYFAIIGFSFILALLLLGHLFIIDKTEGVIKNGLFTHGQFIFKHFVYWKVYTLLAIIFGLSSFYKLAPNKLPLTKHWLILFIVPCFFWLIPFSVCILPLLLLHLLLTNVKVLTTIQIFVIGFISVVLAIAVIVFFGKPDMELPAFYSVFMVSKSIDSISALKMELVHPNHFFNWFYGFSVIMFGYWIGKSKWLINYHFYYNELKRLFKLCLVLILLWLVLNFFHAYELIIHWKMGQVFYMLDAMAMNIVVIYMIVFGLVFLENYRLGKQLLKLFILIGRYWYVNVLIITLTQQIFNAKAISWNSNAIITILLISFISMVLASTLTHLVKLKLNKESF